MLTTLLIRPLSTGLREEMERAEARRLQPHFIQSLFLEAFRGLGGVAREREPKRFELTHVPAVIRNRGPATGAREPILEQSYHERITFERGLINVPGKPVAAFTCPGHPLLDGTIDVVLERHRELLRRGAILIDDIDVGTVPRALVYRSTRSRTPSSIERAVGESFPARCSS